MALIASRAQPDVVVAVHQSTDVASARRAVLHAASRAGFSAEDAGAAAIIVTEAASNLTKHAGGGEVIVRDLTTPERPLIEIIAIDRGRGMASVSRCFEDGYSTGGSPGTGLGAIARLSKFHDIYSIPEKGTVLLAHTGPAAREPAGIQIGAVHAAYPGEDVSGDCWACDLGSRRARFMVADGLGHGVFAAEAALSAIQSLGRGQDSQPAEVIADANLRLRATRGAAVAVADIDRIAGRATFAGVGNVAGAIAAGDRTKRQMVSLNGTVGHHSSKPRQYEYDFGQDSLLVMHSDGLSANWSFDRYPGLFQRHAGVIAGVLFRDFRRPHDDATVVVARWSEPGWSELR